MLSISGDLFPALVVQKTNTRAEGEEHDGDAGADADAGGHAGAAFLATTHDDVRWHRDEQFEHAAGQEVAVQSRGEGGGVARGGDAPEDDRPGNPGADGDGDDGPAGFVAV